ncbi:MAG: hypothetical protein WBV82_05730, partial [Myxococcaceae bacterium]
MRMKVMLVWACTGALLPVAAQAEGEGDSAGAYCDFVEGEAGSESALMIAPQVFGRVGFSSP